MCISFVVTVLPAPMCPPRSRRVSHGVGDGLHARQQHHGPPPTGVTRGLLDSVLRDELHRMAITLLKLGAMTIPPTSASAPATIYGYMLHIGAKYTIAGGECHSTYWTRGHESLAATIFVTRTNTAWASVVPKRRRPPRPCGRGSGGPHTNAEGAWMIPKRRRPPRPCGGGLSGAKAKEAPEPTCPGGLGGPNAKEAPMPMRRLPG